MAEANQTPINPTQEKVATTVSWVVLTGTCLLGVLGMSIAIVAICKDKFDNAKEVLQILFATILPLFGTWIGTILAFYFSKENLAAANRTVEQLVNTITSDKKLASIKARDVMISIEKLTYKEYKTGTNDKTLNLKIDFLDFLNQKGISRIILLDEKKVAKYVLHRSIIESFIAEQYFTSQTATTSTAPQALTFDDLKLKGNENVKAVLRDGVKFIKEDANLSDAKTLIQNYSACNDVFITKTGLETEPVLGWITDKTIAESSIVD
jgi:hypothetical protein